MLIHQIQTQQQCQYATQKCTTDILGLVHVLFMFIVVCISLQWYAMQLVKLAVSISFAVAYVRVYTPLGHVY